jgi:hypothetical protein
MLVCNFQWTKISKFSSYKWGLEGRLQTEKSKGFPSYKTEKMLKCLVIYEDACVLFFLICLQP